MLLASKGGHDIFVYANVASFDKICGSHSINGVFNHPKPSSRYENGGKHSNSKQ